MVYNLYQSTWRKDIQYQVYGKPYCVLRLFDTDYTATIKKKSLGPLTFQWIQILGVEFPDDSEWIQSELIRLKKYCQQSYSNIFIQLGIINELACFDTFVSHPPDFFLSIKQKRLELQHHLYSTYGLVPSFRENMAPSTIIYTVQESDEQLFARMNSGCRERVKKAIKRGLQFRHIFPNEYDMFYDKRYQTAKSKGFHPITKQQFYALISYIHHKNNGAIFVATYQDDIVAGSVCIYDSIRITYLYGFSDRTYANIGGHHFLKFKIFGWAREKGLQICDMMGAAPTGFPDHPLYGVSLFKESLGGTKIELRGSYDIPLSSILYRISKWIHRLYM